MTSGSPLGRKSLGWKREFIGNLRKAGRVPSDITESQIADAIRSHRDAHRRASTDVNLNSENKSECGWVVVVGLTCHFPSLRDQREPIGSADQLLVHEFLDS